MIHDPIVGTCKIVTSEPAQRLRGGPVRRRPLQHGEGPIADSHIEFLQITDVTEGAAMRHAERICHGGVRRAIEEDEDNWLMDATQTVYDTMEVEEILHSGPSTNRIDVVFMGDGYTSSDRDLFYEDIRRLVDDMWNGDTFATVLPLFNVWAVFAPSKDSGIGVGGRPKDTPFGLYRDGTELRGIYCSKPQVARQACRLTGPGACDFPSLIANDDYYGGLGGEFVISTRSNTSGTVVLRHEIGHNFIVVGEEYDGGQVYSGPNSDRRLENIKWGRWLTDEDLKEQRSVVRVQDYAWYDLAKGKYSIGFDSDGQFSKWVLKISASGVEVDDAMEVRLDGKTLEWTTLGLLDRGFYEWSDLEHGFTAGHHTLEFSLGTPADRDAPIRQLCSVTMLEYGTDEDFHMDDAYISAYPTISLSGQKSYRPTNEGCLMRNMQQSTFCSVCNEGLWISLMSRLDLIESVESTCAKSGSTPRVTIVPLPLAQFRKPVDLGREVEAFTVRWYTLPQQSVQAAPLTVQTREAAPWTHVRRLDDQFVADVEPGPWKVEVSFLTEKVRNDEDGVLDAQWQGL
ncbi:hypothetical protein HKX48_002376, partial [Thoreauomyces humboldtii]